jgi:hypothetical protein
MASCPWCNAPRGEGTTCPRCGADYAKAEQIKSQGRAVAAVREPPVSATLVGMEVRAVDDPVLEWKLCAAAIRGARLAGETDGAPLHHGWGRVP